MLEKARELVELARRHGYRQDEVVSMIETLGASAGFITVRG